MILRVVDELVRGREAAHEADQSCLVLLAPGAPRHVDVENQIRARLIGKAEARIALFDRAQIFRLAHRHRRAFARFQAVEAGARTHDCFGLEIRTLDAFVGEEPYGGQCDRIARGRQTYYLPLQVGEALDLGPDDQTVNRVGGLGDDGHRVGALEHRLDQVRRGVLAGIDLAFVQCRNDPIRAAGNRNHIEFKPFADEKSLTLGNRQGKRRQAARGRRILPVA